MSPRIAFWASSFEPEMEAIASEIAVLRSRFPSSVTWGLSHRHLMLFSRRRGYCFHPRLHLVFRAVTRVLEPVFQLNHIFGSLGDWFYLAGKRRRPTIVTMAALTTPVERPILDRVDRFVVEYPDGRAVLSKIGISDDRVRLIFPPVDLQRFSVRPPPPNPFTVLFASSPDKEGWLAARGVPLILDAAAQRPHMRFRLLWRPWGDGEFRVRQWIAERGLQNVDIFVTCSKDMAAEYHAAHVTILPFTDAIRSKPAPNSMIESLACGRPVLVTAVVGLAPLIDECRAGLVALESGTAIAEQLDRLAADWIDYSRNARALAERWFGVEPFVTGYQRLYQELVKS